MLWPPRGVFSSARNHGLREVREAARSAHHGRTGVQPERLLPRGGACRLCSVGFQASLRRSREPTLADSDYEVAEEPSDVPLPDGDPGFLEPVYELLGAEAITVGMVEQTSVARSF